VQPAPITHYSDILCVWAYASQIRMDELRRRLRDQISVTTRFCSVFADVAGKLELGWRERGGPAGYAAHVRSIVDRFDHVELNPDTWARTVPSTSATPHAFVKAASLVCEAGELDGWPRAELDHRTITEELTWRLRLAFFRDARDISRLDVQLEIAAELDLPAAALRARLEDGTAWAALQADYETAVADGIRGSPTFVLNDRRQLLYGNVGYKLIEANVLELLRDPGERASWC
jgi:predicted DsbA family dithiol-disulfide isomerase